MDEITNENNTTPHYDTSQSRESLIRVKKKKSYWKRHPKKKKALIVAGSIIAGLILLWLILWLVGMFGMKTSTPPDPGKEVWYNGHKYVYNENVISTLFIGYDKDSEQLTNGHTPQADYIMLMCLDTQNNKIKAISIPRDMMVQVDRYIGDAFIGIDQNLQIASSYAYGDGKEKSCEYTKNAVSRLLYNMPIKKYFSLNMDGVGPLSNAIDGVSLVPIESLSGTPIKEGKKIVLFGDNAKYYVKNRGEDIDASERRRKRDVQFMEEYYKQGYNKVAGDLTKIIDIYNSGTQYAISNFALPDLIYASTIAFGVDIRSISTLSLIGQKNVAENNLVEIWPDQTQVFETVLSVFYNMVE